MVFWAPWKGRASSLCFATCWEVKGFADDDFGEDRPPEPSASGKAMEGTVRGRGSTKWLGECAPIGGVGRGRGQEEATSRSRDGTASKKRSMRIDLDCVTASMELTATTP